MWFLIWLVIGVWTLRISVWFFVSIVIRLRITQRGNKFAPISTTLRVYILNLLQTRLLGSFDGEWLGRLSWSSELGGGFLVHRVYERFHLGKVVQYDGISVFSIWVYCLAILTILIWVQVLESNIVCWVSLSKYFFRAYVWNEKFFQVQILSPVLFTWVQRLSSFIGPLLPFLDEVTGGVFANWASARLYNIHTHFSILASIYRTPLVRRIIASSPYILQIGLAKEVDLLISNSTLRCQRCLIFILICVRLHVKVVWFNMLSLHHVHFVPRIILSVDEKLGWWFCLTAFSWERWCRHHIFCHCAKWCKSWNIRLLNSWLKHNLRFLIFRFLL